MNRFFVDIFLTVLLLSSTHIWICESLNYLDPETNVYYKSEKDVNCANLRLDQWHQDEICSTWEGVIKDSIGSANIREFSFQILLYNRELEGEYLLEKANTNLPLRGITNIHGKFHANGGKPNDGVVGDVGPFFIKRNVRMYDDWKKPKNLPGHYSVTNGATNKVEDYFRYFMPEQITNTSSAFFSLSFRIESRCISPHVTSERLQECAPPLSRESKVTFRYEPPHERRTFFSFDGEVCLWMRDPDLTKTKSRDNVVYRSKTRMTFKLRWSESEKSTILDRMKEYATEKKYCRPEIRVLMYEAAPRPAGMNINTKLRPILAKLRKKIELNGNDLETDFNLQLESEILKDNESIGDIKFRTEQIELLARHPFLDDDNYFKGWTKENGIKIAINVCMCNARDASPKYNIYDGCTEYQHQPVTIKGELYPQVFMNILGIDYTKKEE